VLFNSLEFAVFFIIVFTLYLRSSHKVQNRLLLVASYIFYGWWDWRFLSLILISTVVDYYCGLKINATEERRSRKLYLIFSIGCNLGLLGLFKYFNFFADSLQKIATPFGWQFDSLTLNVVLPVGISFYTFQTMSYTLDIFRRELKPVRNFLDFALFVSFFPQLVAGPIERAKRLLPQILSPRKVTLNRFYEGCYLIYWGLIQKILIADNLAKIVDPIYAGQLAYSGWVVLLATYAFAFQLYCDFAGYSNIARGLGKCMGFDLMINFKFPYFSSNPKEFWRRWHISLSTWLRDYLYIPLGGNRRGQFISARNLLLTMILGGLWHGAAWTFVVWGAYHGLLLGVYQYWKPVSERMTPPKDSIWHTWVAIGKVIGFFHLWCFGLVFFRAQTISQAMTMLGALFFNFQISHVLLFGSTLTQFLFFVSILMAIEAFQFRKDDATAILKLNPFTRGFIYFVFYFLIMILGVTGAQEFIYFQF